MKKVLIYFNKNDLRPIGGPAGYLYNLSEGLEKISKEEIEISFLDLKTNVTPMKKKVRTSKNALISLLFRIYKRLQHVKDIFSIIIKKKKPIIELNNYDAIHFHTTRDIYYLRKALKNYYGKVILNSHSPQPLSKEYIEGSSKIELLLFGWFYKKLIKMDDYAFRRADYIIFPCETADEPYMNNWKQYPKIKSIKKDSYKYLLSGTVEAIVKRDRLSVRKSLDIPNDAFVICYVGRHNRVKGYDNLKSICIPLISNNRDIYVLVAGSLGPLYPPKSENWKEVGWTNDPHSIIAASDVFVLPNEETYFDLVLLEVLSIGTPLIISNTGGNKYFRNTGGFGVQIYDTFEECENSIMKIKALSKEEKDQLINLNKDCFRKKFSTKSFAQNYINILNEILNVNK